MPISLRMIAAAFFISAVLTGDGMVTLRSGCEPADPVIATLESGSKAQILLSLSTSSGKCYKILAGEVRGYIPASALTGTELYEIAVRLAPAIGSSPAKWAPAKGKSPPVARPSNDPGIVNALVKATRLLTEQQPRAALELLQPGLATAGFDQLVIAGAAARAADDARLAVDLLEKALALRPDRAVEQLLAAARKELSGDRSSERLAATRFILRYEADALQPDTARAVVALLEQEYSRIAAELGCRTDERIVTVVQTTKAYRASSDAAEWSGGHFDGTRIRIPVTTNATVDKQAREALSHELVHACLAKLGRWPSWLHEGFAMKLSGQSTTLADRHKVRSLVRQGKLPRLENVSQSWARMSKEAASNAYLYSLTAVEALYEMHRSTGISAVLRNPDRLPQLSAELDKQMVQ